MFAETQRRALQWDCTLLYGMLISEKERVICVWTEACDETFVMLEKLLIYFWPYG